MDSIHPNVFPSLHSFIEKENERCIKLRAEKRNLLLFGAIHETMEENAPSNVGIIEWDDSWGHHTISKWPGRKNK